MVDIDKLIGSVKKSLEETPKNSALRLHLARLYEEARRYSEALDEFLKVIALDDKNKEAYLGAGKSLYELGEYDASYEHLIKIKSGEGFLYLAKVCLAQDKKEKAEDFYNKAKDFGFKDMNLEKKLFAQKIRVTTEDSPPEFEVEKPKIKFRDVGGMEDIKKKIELKIVSPYKKTRLFQAYGKKAGGGILLYGPPGCGKTLIARATAGEINASFMNLELTDIMDMWRGESEKKLHLFFEQARKSAPSVIFIDEIDALGAARSHFNSAEMKSLVNQLLTELDGISGDNYHILIIGATNMPWQLDPALRRPGRFDKVIFVSPPDFEARVEIFKIHLNGKPQEKIDVGKLAKICEGFSGADIKQVVEQALEDAIEEAIKRNKIIPLTTIGLEKAVSQTRSTAEEWFHTVRNYIEYSNQTGLYDDVAKFMKEHGKI